MQNREDQLLKEYLMLRDEIKSADTLRYQILGIMVTAVSAILVASFNQSDFIARSLIALCAYIITIPSFSLLVGNMRRTWRITTYMRVFLESKDAIEFIRWETRLSKQRANTINKKSLANFSSHIMNYEWLLVTLLNLLAAVVSIGSIVNFFIINSQLLDVIDYRFPIKVYFLIALILATVILNLFLLFYNSARHKSAVRDGQAEKDFYKSWAEIKASEK
ncbi:MAG TPA: hypothetical protein PKY59_20470 [Pyrinomonadaceae bacterium]|nr:hypothetical protein [Pyrinomonadaceae bacterium]